METMKTIFKSSNGIDCPLLEERLAALKEAGSVLLRDYNGKVENILQEASGSAQSFLQIVTNKFSSFRDECEFKGKKVCLWKVNEKKILTLHFLLMFG